MVSDHSDEITGVAHNQSCISGAWVYIYVVCGVVVWIFRYLVVNGGSFHVFAVLCKLYL